ncbi:hypothetical protein B0H14DRAFT_3500132 [Mycena olivaceomarginata]|nr:hypothetical protein B0H14DRAFT_3500132 [Mycena olivaceomarginata]
MAREYVIMLILQDMYVENIWCIARNLGDIDPIAEKKKTAGAHTRHRGANVGAVEPISHQPRRFKTSGDQIRASRTPRHLGGSPRPPRYPSLLKPVSRVQTWTAWGHPVKIPPPIPLAKNPAPDPARGPPTKSPPQRAASCPHLRRSRRGAVAVVRRAADAPDPALPSPRASRLHCCPALMRELGGSATRSASGAQGAVAVVRRAAHAPDPALSSPRASRPHCRPALMRELGGSATRSASGAQGAVAVAVVRRAADEPDPALPSCLPPTRPPLPRCPLREEV